VGLLRRKPDSTVAEIEREVADLEQRRTRLQSELQRCEPELAAVLRERRTQMVESDTDLSGREEVNRLRDRVDDLRDGLVEIGNKITAARGRLDQERDRIARQAEAERRTQQVDAAKQALAHFRAASERLIESLGPLSGVNLEVSGATDNARRMTGFVAVGAEAALVAATSYCAAVAAGTAAVVRVVKAEPIVTAPSPPTVERRLIYSHENIKWVEDGVTRTAGKWSQANPPASFAAKAVSLNLADDFYSARAERLREINGMPFSFPHPDQCIDLVTGQWPKLDTGEETAGSVEFVGPPRISTAVASAAREWR
jgi:hypothetical protein